MNLYRLEENPWHFAIKPEVGFTYELSFSPSWKFAVKYHNGFAASSLEDQGYISISTGLTFGWQSLIISFRINNLASLLNL